jgi:hypothetical protein
VPAFLPKDISLPAKAPFFGGASVSLHVHTGLVVFVGPNGSGKSETLRSVRDRLRAIGAPPFENRKVVYLSSGRSSALETFRSHSLGPHHMSGGPAALGNRDWMQAWWQIEGAPGLFLRLKDRPDLLLKVEARLQALYQRRLRLEWTQSGLRIAFAPTMGGAPYFANVEASGLLELVPLLAALYDDEIAALLIDEPEISLHPQLQAFLLQEIEAVGGDPFNPTKKLVFIATHSPSMLPRRCTTSGAL